MLEDMRMQSHLDHIVIGARSLDEGAAFIEKELGVRVPQGGEHRLMGTHNRVMALGEALYLEIIAVNPEAPPPSRPRWFGLDAPSVQERLALGPALLTWVVNVPDMSRLPEKNPYGEALEMKRDHLEWLITVPSDGALPGNGWLPSIIQWKTDGHPAGGMTDLGCSLQKLAIYHRYSRRFYKNLEFVSADRLVDLHPIDDHEMPHMEAHIRTPDGSVKILSS